MSLEAVAVPFVASALSAVNPFTAHLLAARRGQTRAEASRAAATAACVAVALLAVVAVASWELSRLVSGRLTRGTLVLGLFALVGALYALRPVGRAREATPPPQGARWVARYAADAAYYTGPGWLVATAFAMREVTPAAFALPFVASLAGALAAVAFWVLGVGARLPDAPPRPGAPVHPTHRALALAFGGAAVLMMAFGLGIF